MENKNLQLQENHSQDAFIEDLKEVMGLLDLSQRDLARHLGIRPNHINLFFRSKSDMHSAKVMIMLQLLGIDVHQLVKKRAAQLTGKKSTEVGVLALKLRRLPVSSRNYILRLVDQLT